MIVVKYILNTNLKQFTSGVKRTSKNCLPIQQFDSINDKKDFLRRI